MRGLIREIRRLFSRNPRICTCYLLAKFGFGTAESVPPLFADLQIFAEAINFVTKTKLPEHANYGPSVLIAESRKLWPLCMNSTRGELHVMFDFL